MSGVDRARERERSTALYYARRSCWAMLQARSREDPRDAERWKAHTGDLFLAIGRMDEADLDELQASLALASPEQLGARWCATAKRLADEGAGRAP